ncbi:MAG: hypothetical protein K6G76_09675 [Lachnospiraceae bacterium]|nr:hypothetical protein [Lachnospiraceae bacterium]
MERTKSTGKMNDEIKAEKKKHNLIIHFLIYPVIFVVTVCILTLFMVLSTYVPQEKIVDNYKESADYLCEKAVFFDEIQKVPPSKIDRYADSILLNIGWYFDKEHPFTSVMRDSYYYTNYQNENNNLYDALNKNKDATLQYIRYWHGSAAVVRILHLIFNIKHIYIFHAVLLIILFVLLAVVLCKRKLFEELVALIIGLVIISVWFVPLSLEYTWTFICMFIACTCVLNIEKRNSDTMLYLVFMVTGIITNYLDFLTTETLTLLVPLLLLYRVRLTQLNDKKQFTDMFVKSSVSWGIGYVGMWVTKWILASFILHENVMPYVTEHISERLGGGNYNFSLPEYCFKAIVNNVKCLFPLGYGGIGAVIAILLIFALLYVTYVYHGKDINFKNIIVYSIIGFVPFVRYIVLHNHSFIHYFFTYRAQLVGIMACCFVVFEIVDRRYFKNAFSHRRKA